MDEPKADRNSASAELQAQIDKIADQLNRLCLAEIAKKYKLPKSGLSSPPIPQSAKAIETKFYSVKILCDVHHAHLSWKLNMPAIRERITAIEKPDLVSGLFKRIAGKPENDGATEWSFCGFVSEKSLPLEGFDTAKGIIEKADISSKVDGKLSIDLSPGISRSALFFVMFDHETKLVIEADMRAMIQLPHVFSPSLDAISNLKRQLHELNGNFRSSEPPISPRQVLANEISDALKDKAKLKREFQEIGYSEEDIGGALEDFQTYMTALLEGFAERQK